MLAERNKRARIETSADLGGAGADTAAADAAAEAAIARIAEGINAAPVMGSEAAATSTTAAADDDLEAPADGAASSSSTVTGNCGNGEASSSLSAATATAASDNKKKGLLFPPFLIVHTPRAGDVRLNANNSNNEVCHSRWRMPTAVAPLDSCARPHRCACPSPSPSRCVTTMRSSRG